MFIVCKMHDHFTNRQCFHRVFSNCPRFYIVIMKIASVCKNPQSSYKKCFLRSFLWKSLLLMYILWKPFCFIMFLIENDLILLLWLHGNQKCFHKYFMKAAISFTGFLWKSLTYLHISQENLRRFTQLWKTPQSFYRTDNGFTWIFWFLLILIYI